MPESQDLLNKYVYDYEAAILRAIDYEFAPLKLLSFRCSLHLTSERLCWIASVDLELLDQYPRNREEPNFHTIETYGRTLQEAGDNLYEQIVTFCNRSVLLVKEDRWWGAQLVGRRIRHIKGQDGDAFMVWEDFGGVLRRADVSVPENIDGVVTEHQPGRVKIVFDFEVPGASKELWVPRWKFENYKVNSDGNEIMDKDPYYVVI